MTVERNCPQQKWSMGRIFSPPLVTVMSIVVSDELADEREAARRLGRMADRGCLLILTEDYPRVDIEIERQEVREACERLFPHRLDLYEMVYEGRFNRLWRQFREPPEVGSAGPV